ncbi:hypothetical protein A8L34_10110 [Bacillus sp. FJAT-27264]|uniref:glycerophosphodiester phosphodiesterase family protein n=1 Tax=Paenibacillus sp. (strain DSM 101736 / FJAT-27264) TaxID=1850362 RepID=UPI000807E393|nr:glycerophosphodiester phosphodiesterase family protein [Bacillus sp. FJAT-27264]OBZ14297.1 hypothetical protein A8L34_10110 [Bacillus sp. FJAT-27264]
MFGKAKFSKINGLLNQRFNERGILIAVHRGSFGGNIIENTLPAFKVALQQGGDMIEIDLAKSTDGAIYLFHDGGEPRLLNETDNITTMDSTRIDGLSYYNSLFCRTNTKLDRLEQVLPHLKGDTLINIDRAWDFWPELVEILDQHDMLNQLVLKGPVNKETLEFFDTYEKKYMFMPIIHSVQEIETVLSYSNINLVGMELIVKTDSDPLFQDDVIERLHEQNLFVWANAITLDDYTFLYGGLDDDTSIIQSPDLGWGKIIEKKVDVIQTDWPSLLSPYRNERLKETELHRS